MDEYFDYIFIVNLQHRTDRRAEMEKQLLKAHVMKGQFFNAYQFSHAEPFHRIGSRGNYMSQLAILKKCVSARNVCVLQDDVNFSQDFRARHAIIGSLPLDWAIFYGGYESPDPAKRIEFPNKLNLLDPSKEFIGAHFFAVNGRVIGKLINALETFLARARDHPDGGPMPMDGALNKFRQQNPDLPAYAVYPPLGYQRSSRSDCSPPKWIDTAPIVRQCTQIGRKLKNRLRTLVDNIRN